MKAGVLRNAESKIARAERWRRIGVAALGAVALASYVVLVSVNLARSREREVDAVQRTLDSLAQVLERHALATVDKIDTVLLAGRLYLAQPPQRGNPAAVNEVLHLHLAQIPESQSLRVTDAEGRFVFDASSELSLATIADRGYFQQNKADSNGSLIISEPLFARITHNWVITLSRRLEDARGHFAGIIQAAVRAEYFQDFYTSLKLGPAYSITLFDDQMHLIARVPEAPDQLGKALASQPLREMLATGATEKIYSVASSVDGIERLYAVRKVEGHPLYVLVGRSTEDYLASWYRQLRWSVAGIMALTLVMVGWVVVWLRTYEAAQRLARRMTEAYETTMNRTRTMLDNLPDPAWLSDREGKMIAVNEAYCRACGREQDDIIGHGVCEIWHGGIAETLATQDARTLESQQQQRQEERRQTADGRWHNFEFISTPVLDNKNRLVGVAGVARDITQFREDQERIRHLAEHDLLTDLPNRALLGDRMATALAETIGEQAQIALLFIDLDHFKNINDTLGHDVGDQLLIQVAQRLQANLHERDIVSRQGGDEFAILLRGYSNPTRIAVIARRLIDALSPPFRVAGHELRISASIGISTYPHDGADIGTLLKNADTAMYQAKATGGNAYQFFTEEMNARIQERVAMENSLRQSLADGEFVLHYQPQIDGATGRMVGVEALIRWQHPDLGNIPPSRFIPVAEESGLINGIGDWALQQACHQARAWMDQGHDDLTMAVNLSAVQFRQPDLALKVSAALAAANLPARRLELEITESAFIRDTERIIGVLTSLKALGIKLSVDDFGTGYSSLGYLKRLPFDKIKIDQSFVRGLPGDDDDVAITQAIIAIARSLKKEVIAEGVETVEQREFLLSHGCRLMQGFHFAKPMSAVDLQSLLTTTWSRGDD